MSNPKTARIVPNRDRHRTEFLSVRTLLGMSRQDQADFSWVDLKRFFKVSLWDRSRKCAGCGKPIETFEEASLDHIIPRSKGGRTRLCNLQLMHMRCNSKKSSKIVNVLSRRRFAKAHQPAQSRTGQLTRREMGLSVNGRASIRRKRAEQKELTHQS